MIINPIAYFHSPFSSKFGVPKQSGLVDSLIGFIEMTENYNRTDFLRGLNGFDYLWLIWQFSENRHKSNSALVRPPLLGGNEKVGVFASRSPYRPNALGLSSVRLDRIETDAKGPLRIYVKGADLMDGTPIFDIKPYVGLSDCHPEARCGFVDHQEIKYLDVEFPKNLHSIFNKTELDVLAKILALDPRPHYHNNDSRIYGMPFMAHDIRFVVNGDLLSVTDVVKSNNLKP